MNGYDRLKLQYKENLNTDKALIKIIKYLLNQPEMSDIYLKDEKNIKEMMDYIKSKAKEQAINNVAIIEDQNVYEWAIDYYIKSNEELGITKINNKITFVSDVLPNEIVDVKIINEKKNFNEAKVISYIEKSSDRIENKCPYSDKCGGCDFGYLNYKTSLMYKKNMVVDVMKRYAGLDINPSIISSDNIFGYRNKISLRINDGKLCLIEKNSNDYISISRCLLVNDNINKVIGILNDCDLYGIRDIVIRGTDEIMVIINGDDINNDIICRLDGNVSSIVFNGNLIYGKEYINILVDKFKYAIYPNSFFQVNTDMIRGLYDEVKESAGSGHSLLDLYCGAGTIGIYLADNFGDVHGIEINEDAVTGANVNKRINNIKNISSLDTYSYRYNRTF